MLNKENSKFDFFKIEKTIPEVEIIFKKEDKEKKPKSVLLGIEIFFLSIIAFISFFAFVKAMDNVLPPLKVSEKEIELLDKNEIVINDASFLYEKGQKPIGTYEKIIILNEAILNGQISKSQAQKIVINGLSK